jgi:acyl carrier protein
MNADIESKVIAIMQGILGRSFGAKDLETPRSEIPEWNSLVHVEVIFLCEDQFEIEFLLDELPTLNTINALVASISGKLG